MTRHALFLGMVLLLPGMGCAGARVGDPTPALRADAGRRLEAGIAHAPGDGVWSERDAVACALARNPRIGAALARAGVARAELQQALTPENPHLGFSARLPHEGGGVGLEIDVVQEILSLLLRPARGRAAHLVYEAERHEAAQAIVAEAIEVSEAWYGLVAAGQLLAMRRLVAEAAAASHEVAQRVAEAGNLSRLGLAREAAAHAQAEADALDAERDLVEARERLRRGMGLAADDGPLSVSERLPDLPEAEPPLGALTIEALRGRPDVAALGLRCRALCIELGLARDLGPYDEIGLGVSSERESEGHWFTGPALEVEIPVFDQGQARRALLAARLREARWEARALEAEVRSHVRDLHGRLEVLRRAARLRAERLVPAREQVVALSQQEYNFMLLGVDKLLEAKREEFDAYAAYVETIREYWVTRARLERAAGGRIPLAPAIASPGAPAGSGPGGHPQHQHPAAGDPPADAARGHADHDVKGGGR